MRVLSVDGGGYLGLATASFIADTERHFNISFHKAFDLFCGTSTGAIIALALAKGLSGEQIRTLYEDFGPNVFWNPIPGCRALRWLRGLVMARYSNRYLRKALAKVFDATTLGDLRRSGKHVLVAAFSVSKGHPRIFKTDHSTNLTLHDSYRLTDVALASSAAPVYLPLVKLSSPSNGATERFCDGGVFANHPALLGFAEAVYELRCAPKEIRLLSLSTPRSDLSEPESSMGPFQRFRLSRGALSWASRLATIFIDSASTIAHETLRRMASAPSGDHAVYERIRLPKPAGVDLDIASPKATSTLLQLGSEAACSKEGRDSVRRVVG